MEQQIRHIIEFAKDKPEPLHGWIPLFQAAIWPVVVLVLVIALRKYVCSTADALIYRIRGGSKLTFGPVSIGEGPKELAIGGAGAVAVSDPNNSTELPPGFTESQLSDEYHKLIEQGFFLLHVAEVVQERTAPKSGRYRVRIWVESYYDKPLEDIVRVTYRVWDDFRRPIISTASRDSNYDLWVSIYGEFPVLAFIELKNKPPVIVSRYIDLPGRPPD